MDPYAGYSTQGFNGYGPNGFSDRSAQEWFRGSRDSWWDTQRSKARNYYRNSKFATDWGPKGLNRLKGWGGSFYNVIDRNMANSLFRFGTPIGIGLGAGLAVYAARRDKHSVDSSIVTGSLTALAVGGGIYGLMAKRASVKKALLAGAEWMTKNMFEAAK